MSSIRKQFLLIIKLFFLISTIFSFLFILLSGCKVVDDIINISGSSSMFPLFSAFSKTYPDADLSVQSGGSASGINSVLEGKKDIGNVSKNLDEVFEEKKGLWVEKKIKTVTIGIDGIAIVYKKIFNDDQFNITQDNILALYDAFAGTRQVSYKEFGEKNSNSIIKPYARTGAAFSSGTAEAFLNSSGFNTSGLNNETKEILLGKKEYKRNVKTTPETNSQAWDYFVKDTGSGVIYLSAGYVYKNIDVIIKSNCGIAQYNGVNLIDENNEEDALHNVGETYKWYRQYNSLFSLNYSNSKHLEYIKKFVYWIATNPDAKKIKQSYGVIPLKMEWLKSMFKNGNVSEEDFYVSDEDLGHAGALINSN